MASFSAFSSGRTSAGARVLGRVGSGCRPPWGGIFRMGGGIVRMDYTAPGRVQPASPLMARLIPNQGAQMRNTDSFLRTATGAAMLVASLLAWPITGAAQLGGLPLPPPPLPIGGGGTTQTVNGIASAVQAYSLGTMTTLASTGTLSGLTDAREASQLAGSVPALLSAETLHATAIGLSDRIASQASLGNLVLGIGATSISADAVLAQAEAAAGSATGSSVLGNLTLNGVPVDVSGAPNQTISLPGGRLVINEQTATAGGIVVNALHLVVDGVTDVVLGSATAAIQ